MISFSFATNRGSSGAGGYSSVESSPIKQASNVGTPMGKQQRRELSFSSVDVSPIGSSFDEDRHNNGGIFTAMPSTHTTSF